MTIVCPCSWSRRKKRFDGHLAVVQEFACSLLGFPTDVWSVVRRKPNLRPELDGYMVELPFKLVPRSEMVRERWASFLQEQDPFPDGWEEDSSEGNTKEKKKLRSRSRRIAYLEDKFGPGNHMGEHELCMLANRFAGRYRDDEELLGSIPASSERKQQQMQQQQQVEKEEDPIQLVGDFGMLTDECSDADTNSIPESDDGSEENLFHLFFEEQRSVQMQTCTKRHIGTKASMNPLSGYEILPALKDKFASFVAARDARLKAEAKVSRNQRIQRERIAEHRSSKALTQLFDATVEAFVDFMRSEKHGLRMSGYKYCPTPGCSADKATGNLESGGIGEAMMRRLGFASICMSPTGGRREFKVPI